MYRVRLVSTALLLCAGAAFGVAVPASALPLLPHHPKITHESTHLGDWRLDIARDPFSGEVVCRLGARNHKAIYRASAVGFRFKHKWNTTDAVYRLDGGRAVPR